MQYRNKDCDVIYVSPAHMTKWGEIMPVSRRMELVHYAAQKGSLIIEDDFENEFVSGRPRPFLTLPVDMELFISGHFPVCCFRRSA